MGQKKSKSSDSPTSFANRLLVILFALGMVVIGVQPIKGQLRKYVEDAKSFARTNLPILLDDANDPGADSRADRRALSPNTVSPNPGTLGEETRRPELPKGIAIDEASHKRGQLDKLSKEDRKQLSELVNQF